MFDKRFFLSSCCVSNGIFGDRSRPLTKGALFMRALILLLKLNEAFTTADFFSLYFSVIDKMDALADLPFESS